MAVYREPILSIRSMPLVPVAIAYATGLTIGFFCQSMWLVAGVTVAVILFIAVRQRVIAFMAVAILLGLLYGAARYNELTRPVFTSGRHECHGVIADVRESYSALFMTVEVDEVDGCKIDGCRMSLTVPGGDGDKCLAGRQLRFKFDNSESYRTILPEETDYYNSLWMRGLMGVAIVESDSIAPYLEGGGVLNFARGVRSGIVGRVLTSGLSWEAASFLAATLVGDDAYIDSDTRDTLARAGIAHVLALSGTHVAVVTMILGLIFFPFHALGRLRWYRALIIIALWGYALLTGFTPSVTRAVVMASIYLLSLMIERRVSPLNSIAVAAIVILVVDPVSIFSVSFQLSFIAVTAIVICGSASMGVMSRLPGVLRFVVGYVVVTMAATLSTAPLVAYYFHIFPLSFLLSNFVAVVVLPLFLSFGILSVVVSALSLPGGAVYWVVDRLYDVLAGSSELLTGSASSVISGLYPSAVEVFVVYVAIAAWLIVVGVGHERRRRYVPIAVASSIMIMPVCAVMSRPVAASEWMLAGLPDGNVIILKDGNVAWLISDVQQSRQLRLKRRLESRLGNYLARRGIDTLSIMPEKYSTDLVDRNGRSVNISGNTFLFVDNECFRAADSVAKVDYVIVSRYYRGNLRSLTETFSPGTIAVGADVHHRVSRRLLSEESAGAAVVNLRERFIRPTATGTYSSNAPETSSSR